MGGYRAYNGPIGIQTPGALLLEPVELTSGILSALINDGPILTATTFGALTTFFGESSMSPEGAVQSVGALVLTAAELAPNMLIRIVNDGPILTVTTLGYLAEFISSITIGLALDGIALVLTNPTGWQTSSAGLTEGDVWANGIFVAAVPGATPDPSAGPLFFGAITAAGLLSLGAGNLPLSDPGVTDQLWLNGILVCVSAG